MTYEEEQAHNKKLRDMPTGTKDELIAKLRALRHCEQNETGDTEVTHVMADQALLEFIGDPQIGEEFALLRKWYA